MTSKTWLNDELLHEVRKTFEPRYKRELSDNEVTEIAENLTGFMEVLLKWQWKHKHTQ